MQVNSSPRWQAVVALMRICSTAAASKLLVPELDRKMGKLVLF